MKIYIANDSQQSLGGGFSFLRNFSDGLHKAGGAILTPLMSDADVVFIPSSSMVKSETVAEAEVMGKPMVLRVDNIPRDSRNRNTGTSRLLSYYEKSRAVVFQSNWASMFVGEWLSSKSENKPSQTIIYNGLDKTVFRPDGDKIEKRGPVYLYSRFNRDETKNWHVVWYEYQLIHRKAVQDGTPLPELWLVGQFSPEMMTYDPTGNKVFDFFQGEVVHFMGVVQNADEYATILRSADYLLAPYYNDACSNTIIEAFACGIPVETFGYGHTGGTPELFALNENEFDWSNERMAKEYIKVMEKVL
jgi:glycosyltransferase involved in cell wall biosynthesis